MRTFRSPGLYRPALPVIALLLAATVTNAAAETWQPVGRDHGLQVYAEVDNGTWCQDSVGIKIVSDDIRTFADGAIDDTLADVGAKLARSCPKMTGFQVFGEVSPSSQVVYQAIAAREQGWEPMVGKAPTVQRATAPASAPAVGGIPSTGIPSSGSIEAIVSGNTLYGQTLPTIPARSAYMQRQLARTVKDSAMYFNRNGSWVERQSQERRGRLSEQYNGGQWSIRGNQLCMSRSCFNVGRGSDGSIVLIGTDGKRYRQFDRSVPGDPDNLVQGQAAYAQKVEESNKKAMALLGLFVGMAAMSGGGGGGGGAVDPRDDPIERARQQSMDRPTQTYQEPPQPYTPPIGGERGLYGGEHGQ